MTLNSNKKVLLEWVPIVLCTIFVLSSVTLVICGECPPKNYTKYCNCTEESETQKTFLQCRGVPDLASVFNYIAYYLMDWEKKVFDRLEINKCETPIIKKSDEYTLMEKTDLFVQLKFKSIAIRNCGVTEIDPFVLAGTASTLRTLTMDFPHLSDWQEVYHSIVHLPNLVDLHLPANDKMLLPDNAFDKHIGNDVLALENIYFSNMQGGFIIRIGSYSFQYLEKLRNINFENVKIGAIDDYAFAFKSGAQLTADLEIVFSAQSIIKTSIDKDAFLNTSSTTKSHRKVVIRFATDNASYVCEFSLKKEIYKPFLDENECNEISVQCMVDCKEIIWITSNYKYQNRVNIVE